MLRRSILSACLLAAVAGCQTSQDAGPETAKPTAATPVTPAKKEAAPTTAPAKEPSFYEISSGDTVYVFASVDSANKHVSGEKLTNAISRPNLKPGKTVVFENVGPATDAVIAAWAKANNVKLK